MKSPASSSTTPDQTSQRWQAAETELCARAAPASPGAPEQVAGKSGLQMFQAMIAGELPAPPITQHAATSCWSRPTSAAPSSRAGPASRTTTRWARVHGGWFATLLDSALGCAVHSVLPAGKAYTTLELKVNIVRALSDKVPLVRAESRHHPRRRPHGDRRGPADGPDGKLYAHGSTTCFIFDAPHETPPHHASRRRPAALDRLLHPGAWA